MKRLSLDTIKSFRNQFDKDSNNGLLVAKNAMTNSKAKDVIINQDVVNKLDSFFSNEINLETTITNQENSGRCWIFSFLNIINFDMISKYDLESDFELSYSYLFFWDQLEKANYFLNNVLKFKDEEVTSRMNNYLFYHGICDGGHFHMIKNLINKYGLVPKSSMNENMQANNTSQLNALLNTTIKSFGYQLREGKNSSNQKLIEKMMYYIYSILVVFLGSPPDKVKWHYYKKSDDSKKSKKIKSKSGVTHKIYRTKVIMTPIEFFKKVVKFPINDYILIGNYPHPSKPFYQLYTINYLNNMMGDENLLKFVNLPIKDLKISSQKSLTNNQIVWFCGDISKESNHSLGILDKNVMDYSNIFDLDFIKMDKGNRMIYKNAEISHAMVFRGFHSEKKNDIPEKWLVENSWGESIGKKGRYVMSNEWFEDNVFCIAINKKFLDSKVIKIYKTSLNKSKKLDPWDIFGYPAIL